MRDYYKEMSEGRLTGVNGYGATLGKWMEITGTGYKHDEDDGWKFKISVQPHDVPKAWNIVADILLRYPIPQSAAVALPERLKNKPQDSAIIIDTMHSVSPARYMLLMNAIEQKLREAGIEAQPPQDNDRAIENSAYLSYGWDEPVPDIFRRDRGGRPLIETYNRDHVTKDVYNPSSAEDPYRDFKVDGDEPQMAAPSRVLPPMLPAGSQEQEFSRHQWFDATTGGNNPIPLVRLPLLGMEMERSKIIQRELKALGLKYEVAESNEFKCLVLRLRGDDARRFREINPATPHFLLKEWQSTHDNGGQKITRLAINTLKGQGDLARTWMELQQAGFTPIQYDSATLGKTIRLVGADATRLEEMQSKVPPHWRRKPVV